MHPDDYDDTRRPWNPQAYLDGFGGPDQFRDWMMPEPPRVTAMDALTRALDREHGGAFVEPVEVVE